MEIIAIGIVGFLLGLAAGYIWFNKTISSLKEKNVGLSTRLEHEAITGEKLETSFKALASETLQKSGEQFLTTALKDLRQVKTEADENISKQKMEIYSSVAEMKQKLEEYQNVIKVFEQERSTMYGKIEQSLSQVFNTEQKLQQETTALKTALTTSSGIQGQWGQLVLQEILEQNNLVKGIHFDTQETTTGNDGANRLIPDFIIKLPGGKKLVIDSKAVIREFILSQDTSDPQKQKEHYKKLVANIRENFLRLASKDYRMHVDPEVPFVIMFIPSEAAIRAAFITDPQLFYEANDKKVILASPMTIIPLILLIEHSWQQHKFAENAVELFKIVEEYGNRLSVFVSHLSGLQTNLKRAGESWNEAIGSWETRVVPQRERIQELGGKFKDVKQLGAVETDLKQIEPPSDE